jgi:hypothetical protein
MPDQYLEVISLIERLHRQFLEIVKLELEGLGIHDINNVQGLMLFNIGDAEMTVGELTWRGCYLGSNVSYNVKKMRCLLPSTAACAKTPATLKMDLLKLYAFAALFEVTSFGIWMVLSGLQKNTSATDVCSSSQKGRTSRRGSWARAN